MDDTTNYAVKYMCIYRHVHSNLISEWIKPFTQSLPLFDLLLHTMIFIDQDSRLPFSDLMVSEFSKLTSSPSLVYTITGEVISNIDLIINTFNDLYNEFMVIINANYDNAFNMIAKQTGTSWEKPYNAQLENMFDNKKDIEDYVSKYVNQNKTREEIIVPRVNGNASGQQQPKSFVYRDKPPERSDEPNRANGSNGVGPINSLRNGRSNRSGTTLSLSHMNMNF